MNLGWTQTESPFHVGEQDVQTRMGVRDKIEKLGRRVVRDYLPEQHREFYSLLPFLIVGMTDEQRRPWVSILTGKPGFISSPDPHHLRIATQPLYGSPIATQLQVGADMGILGILPESRRRNRSTGQITAVDSDGITVAIAQTFGNCPQYIQTRDIEVLPEIAHPPQEKEIETGDRLDEAAKALIAQSDTLFVATAYHAGKDSPTFGADASHRGGKPGFIRVEDDQTFIFPDFTGNFHFNTVGNILLNPKAGFLFIDFETRDVLYLTGSAEIIWDGAPVNAFVGAERFIRFHVEEWRRVKASLPLQFQFGEYSPMLQHSGSWEQMDETLTAERQKNLYRDYEVFKVEPESDTISSFYLRRLDGKSLPTYEPGQFLPIRLTIPGQSEPTIRVYTLSDAPNGAYYRLSIKREGLASSFFHDQVGVGSQIEALSPRGKFKLNASSDRPVVLVSAGIGITPMMAIANFLIEEGIRTRTYRSTYFIHGARNGKVHAFGQHIRHLTETYPSVKAHIRYSQPDADDQLGIEYDSNGHVDMDLLKQVLPFDDFDFYLCGPQSFMQSLYNGLIALGVRAERIHYESFGPATVFEHATASPTPSSSRSSVTVRFAKSALETEWTSDKGTLLELAEANGLNPAFSCRAGLCGVCATQIQCGIVDYVEEPTAHYADGEILICCSTPRSPSGTETCGDDVGIVLDL